MSVTTKRVALVTGAARGLGLAIAGRLAGLGYPVVLADADPAVEDCAGRLRDKGLAVRHACVDVADDAAVQSLPDLVGDWWDDLSILVNNAGISPKADGRKRRVAEMPADEW